MEKSLPAFQSAPDDACAMLNFASSRGIEVDNKITSIIVEATENFSTFDKDLETEFWSAYSKLAKLISPVTLGALQAQTDSCTSISILDKSFTLRMPSPAKRSVIAYTLLTIAFLTMFLVIEIYNYIGSYAVTQLNEITDVRHKLQEGQVKARAANDNQQLEYVFSMMKENTQKELATYAFITSWNQTAELFITFFFKKTASRPADTLSKDELNQYQRALAEMTIRSINIYLIPMVCGLLGVCSYILRTLSEEIKNYTFTRESLIRFRLRIPLGCLVGAVAGLILNTTGTQVTSALPPIGLSFAFGYSVEAFFVIIDSALASITKKQNTSSSTG